MAAKKPKKTAEELEQTAQASESVPPRKPAARKPKEAKAAAPQPAERGGESMSKAAPKKKTTAAKPAAPAQKEPAPKKAPAKKVATPKAAAKKASTPRRASKAEQEQAAAESTPPLPEAGLSSQPGSPVHTPPHREALELAGPAETDLTQLEQVQPTGGSSHQELPPLNTVTRLVLMVRDPQWLYAYWEITAADREAHQIGQPHGAPPLLLRINDMGEGPTPVETDHYFDVTVIADVTGWYVHVPRSGGHWRAALGYLNNEGEFVALCQSNRVTASADGKIALHEQNWGPVPATVDERAAAAALQLAGVPEAVIHGTTGGEGGLQAAIMAGLRPGASEQLLRPGASEQLLRPGASEQVGLRPGASEMVPGSLAPAREEAPKGFWLVVHTELIVYGATEPDARVTVQGNPIRLRPDGTFTLRFALPDGEQVIPVRAVSADGDFERIITPIVTKKTE